jgi:hypothetical protein
MLGTPLVNSYHVTRVGGAHTDAWAWAPLMMECNCLASYSGCSVTSGLTAACSSWGSGI